MDVKKKTSNGEKPMTKTAFVRALPADMPAKDVVEKAKAEGLVLSEGYVYEIRSAAKRSKKRSARRPSRAPSAKVTGGAKGARGRQAEGSPAGRREAAESVPAASVAKVAPRSTSGKSAVKGAQPAQGGEGAADRRFVDLVAEIGLGRADALLADFRAKLRMIRAQ